MSALESRRGEKIPDYLSQPYIGQHRHDRLQTKRLKKRRWVGDAGTQSDRPRLTSHFFGRRHRPFVSSPPAEGEPSSMSKADAGGWRRAVQKPLKMSNDKFDDEYIEEHAHDRPCRHCGGAIVPEGDIFACVRCGKWQLPCIEDGCPGWLEYKGTKQLPSGPHGVRLCSEEGCECELHAPPASDRRSRR